MTSMADMYSGPAAALALAKASTSEPAASCGGESAETNLADRAREGVSG